MPRVPMSQVLDEAQKLLTHTYNRMELRQLLQMRMDIVLEDIAPNATGNIDLVFELLTWMDRRSRVIEFLRIAAAERATVPAWQEFAARVAEPAVPAKAAAPSPPTVLASAGPPPAEVKGLARGYSRLKQVLPECDAKTVQLQAIVDQLLALPLEEFDLVDRFHLGEDEGERLVAALTLVRRPDPDYLRWLGERMAVESRFFGYQAAVALESAARTLPVLDLNSLMTVVECARQWIPADQRQDKGRWGKLNSTAKIAFERATSTRKKS